MYWQDDKKKLARDVGPANPAGPVKVFRLYGDTKGRDIESWTSAEVVWNEFTVEFEKIEAGCKMSSGYCGWLSKDKACYVEGKTAVMQEVACDVYCQNKSVLVCKSRTQCTMGWYQLPKESCGTLCP